MNTLATTNGPVGEALTIKVNTDLNADLHAPFTVRYSNNPAENIIHNLTTIPTLSLDVVQLFETWQGVNNCSTNPSDPWQIYRNDQYLIAAVPAVLLEHLLIDEATEKAYSLIFEQLNIWGYPYLLRTWNFFPEITGDSYSHNDNYQQFCSGRARAYAKMAPRPQPYPAATVIGTQQTGLYIYFIAAKKAGVGIENSQQVSAFEYPSTYSQDPPLFSRALLHRNPTQEILFISGTASITGHSTQYDGDITRQTEVCLANIENLISTATVEHKFSKMALDDFSLIKVYLKNPNDINTVRTHIQQMLGPSTPIYYLQGDMCRSDLLVEIEALAINSHR